MRNAFAAVASLALFLALTVEQCKGEIQLGAKLSVGESWVSSGSTFAIGFYTANTPGMLNLAIWYYSVKVNPKTVVWTAMANDQPLEVSKNAQLVLQNNGLVVKNGSQNVWQTTEGCEGCVASADMTESGNFVLLNSGMESLWQSFSSPGDTLLPSQQLAGNMTLTAGKYILQLSKNGAALQYQDYLAEQPYWSMAHTELNASDPSLKAPSCLNLSSIGVLRFYDANGSYKDTQKFALDYGSTPTRRLTLETSGNLRIYSLAPGNDSWDIVWQAMLMECDIYGACGAFGLCRYRPQPTCSCPPGFHVVNPRDVSAGCTYNVPLASKANSTNNKLIQLDRADYLENKYKSYENVTMSLETCRNLCLEDFKCLAATYKLNGLGQCVLKGGNDKKLYNGHQAADQDYIGFLKVSTLDTSARDDAPAQDPFVTSMNATSVSPAVTHVRRRSYFSEHAHSIVLSIAIAEFVLFCATVGISWFCFRRTTRKMWQKFAVDTEGAPTRFSYEQLQAVTDNFSHKLGSGGFGTVYKGELPDKIMVAVKQLEMATQAEKQFHAEVATIGKIHHINLVRLLGYCAEGSHKLLVYEYMPKGSLEKVLCSEESNNYLCDWNTRFTIATGIARGLAYLHEECHECILHCDIKPENILLDEEFCPKVSDFGLAKLMKREHAFNVTTIRGTRGYLAPEWISNLPITAKADVYSFGMVLLEIISGRDKFMFASSATNSNRWYFPLWAFEKYIAADLDNIADPKLAGNLHWGEFERVLKVAFWCIQLDANSRPSMSKVVQMLEDNTEVPVPPFPKLLEDDLPAHVAGSPN